jgi:hypothetical protein
MGTGMDTTTDTILAAIPTLGYSLDHLSFLFPLLRQFDTTITGRTPLTVTMIITNRVIGFGFRDIGDIEKLPTVREGFGFLVTGNGDRINKERQNTRVKESRPKSDFGRLSFD